METVIVDFEKIPPLHRNLILIGGLCFSDFKRIFFSFQYKK